MKNKKETKEIINILKEMYPDAKCSLNFNTPFQITIAVLLSAQATDIGVNKATAKLFLDYPTIYDMEKLSISEIEDYIKTINYHYVKAKHIFLLIKKVIKEYGGEIPNNMTDLLSLPGIGRKSANVILLEGFSSPVGIAVDTHAKRISNRIGFSEEDDPQKVEQDLLKVVDKKDYYDANHLFVWHGRYICKARKPECERCKLQRYCKFYKEK